MDVVGICRKTQKCNVWPDGFSKDLLNVMRHYKTIHLFNDNIKELKTPSEMVCLHVATLLRSDKIKGQGHKTTVFQTSKRDMCFCMQTFDTSSVTSRKFELCSLSEVCWETCRTVWVSVARFFLHCHRLEEPQLPGNPRCNVPQCACPTGLRMLRNVLVQQACPCRPYPFTCFRAIEWFEVKTD